MRSYPLKLMTFFSTILSLLILGENKILSQENNLNNSNNNQPVSLETDTNEEGIIKAINSITVKIIQNNQVFSGTIISQKGNNYLVLTNNLSIDNNNSIKIVTQQGITYPGKIVQFDNKLGDDFSLVEFNSIEQYPIAEIDTGRLENYINIPIYIGRFSSETGSLIINQGRLKHKLDQPLQQGYEIGFDNEIQADMSGGAIFWNRNNLEPYLPPEMLLIGISGKDLKKLSEYLYQNGEKPTLAEKK